jgi:hypothetical protein
MTLLCNKRGVLCRPGLVDAEPRQNASVTALSAPHHAYARSSGEAQLRAQRAEERRAWRSKRCSAPDFVFILHPIARVLRLGPSSYDAGMLC